MLTYNEYKRLNYLGWSVDIADIEITKEMQKEYFELLEKIPSTPRKVRDFYDCLMKYDKTAFKPTFERD